MKVRNPMSKVLIMLVSGFLVSYFFGLNLNLVLIVQVILLGLLLLLRIQKKYFLHSFSSLFILLLVFSFGGALFQFNKGTLKSYLEKTRSDEVLMKAVVYNSPKASDNTKLYVNVKEIYLSGKIKKEVTGRFYLKVNNSRDKFNFGDVLLINTRVKEIKNQGNPGEFDFENFMIKKGIYHQGFANIENVRLVDNEASWFVNLALVLRSKVLRNIDQSFSKNEAPIAKALLVGYKGDVDSETRTHYASSGASHILAVSGMHVGIIMLIISKINSIWARSARTKKLATFLLLALLWFYVFLTGFSPSILRAGLMFSLVLIGRLIQKDHSKLNLLCGSAVILLVYDPYYLFDLGFQLSYLAIGGIFFVYPKLVVIYYSKYKLLNKLWELSIVSISAQIATLPLTMYYFHQFPNAFLITNVVTTICASLILFMGLLFIVFQEIDFLSDWFAFFAGKLIEWMNLFVAWIDSFDFSVTKGIYLNWLQLLLLFVISIIFLLNKLETRKQRIWLFSLVVCSISGIYMAGIWTVPRKDEFVVFHTRKDKLLNVNKNGVNYYYISDSENQFNKKKLNDYWSMTKDEQSKEIVNSDTKFHLNDGVMLFDDVSILFVNNRNSKLLKNHSFDYVVIGQDSWVPKEIGSSGLWILTGELSTKKRQFLINKLRKHKLPYHETSVSGAFIQKL